MPARPLSCEAYELKLARIIEEFQRRIKNSEVRGKLRMIVNGVALSDADPPSYRDLWERYGVAVARNQRHLAGRLRLLTMRGQLEVVGHRIRYGAALYRAVSTQRKRSAATVWVNTQLDALDTSRAAGNCLAARAAPVNDREEVIIAERLAGKTLAAIAVAHGLTRERVRQLIAKTVDCTRTQRRLKRALAP
jgi:DNA-binding CsgD family transcriptional regulator